MKFDRMGRRVEYIETVNGVTNTHHRFVYDGYVCIQRLNAASNNAIDLVFTWDPSEPIATRPLVLQKYGQYNLFYTHDGNKNVSELVFFQQANGIAAHYEYAPFGAVTATSRSTPVTAYDFREYNPFRFSSEYEDDAFTIMYYNYRHYSPTYNRWNNRDPVLEISFPLKKSQPSFVNSYLHEYSFLANKFGAIDLLGLEECVCGPDITQWLVDQMNENINNPVIKTMREVTWPRYVPVFNIGWTTAALWDFADLVKAGAPWDFKATQTFTSSNCPKGDSCERTVTLCGECVDYDVAGNIHYGFVGSAGGLRAWVLHRAASLVQTGLKDPPEDYAAIELGIKLWHDSNKDFCSVFGQYKEQLNYGSKDKAKKCSRCEEEY